MTRRILYVIGSLEIGGAERHVVQVATRLKRRGWSPEIFALQRGGPLTAELTDAGIPVYGGTSLDWLNKWITNKRLRARIALCITAMLLLYKLFNRRPSVVHFFLPAAYIIGGLTSLLLPVKARLMSRRSLNYYQSSHPRLARVERFLHRRMKLICGNSSAVIRDLEQEGVEPKRLRLIHNGIDLEKYDAAFDKAAARCRFDIPDSALVFVVVANLIPYKGHADIIAAFSQAEDALPNDWLVLFVGRDDGIGEHLKAQINTLGHSANYRFLGSRTDVQDIMRLSDVGLLASHEEGFSNAVIEGMASGLPMVVTDVGGNSEAVIDGLTGYVVPAKRPDELGRAIVTIAEQHNRKDMGLAGKDRVRSHFSMNSCIDAYEGLYREASGKGEKT